MSASAFAAGAVYAVDGAGADDLTLANYRARLSGRNEVGLDLQRGHPEFLAQLGKRGKRHGIVKHCSQHAALDRADQITEIRLSFVFGDEQAGVGIVRPDFRTEQSCNWGLPEAFGYPVQGWCCDAAHRRNLQRPPSVQQAVPRGVARALSDAVVGYWR